MTDKKPPRNSGPLDEFGAALIDNGYMIVPIAVGKKAPGFDNWSKSRSTKIQLKEWIENGHRNSGVGILTKLTPGVDLDIRDERVALEAEAKAREIFGDAPLRIGRPPKRLLLYRTDTPFPKMRSTKYKDEWGELHQIEILCDGQQFVAYHTHPDTGKPYIWPDEDGPKDTPISALPVITVEQCQELIDWFEERAKQESDWVVAKAARKNSTGAVDYDNPFLEDSTGIEISDDELRNRLMLVPGAEDYDTWLQVGMALYHQYDGEEIGKELWNEWAETADNYDADSLERRWDDFAIQGKKRAPITARYILRLSKEAVESTTAALSMQLRDGFANATTLAEWEKARTAAREAEIDGLARSALAQTAKEKRDQLTGTKTPLSEIKKAIAYQPAKAERTPSWASPWVYDTTDDRFFSTDSKISTTQQGFNAMFDRKAMTKKDILDGRSSPASTASALALNLYKIPVVNGRRYEPGRDPIYHTAEGVFANTYPEHEIPALPDKILPRDKRAIERIKRHIEHLLTNPVEQRLFLDWLSWVVQNPGLHANWAILLQGTEGDGKSFFGTLMRGVMGISNVRMLDAHTLESSFTDWSVGQCLTCIEEVRLIKAANKYEVLNKMKPFITNSPVEVHPKGGAPYNARNTTSYLLFSNYRDALPIDGDGRRYCILFSQWQRGDRLNAFNDENPDYYGDLYRTVEECAPALRQWLLEHEQLESFNPLGNAPETAARKFMIQQAQPEFIQTLTEIIREKTSPLVSDNLVEAEALRDMLMARGVDIPAPKAMSAMLSRHRFESLGRVLVEGKMNQFYSREPERFQCEVDGQVVTDPDRLSDYIRTLRIDDDDEL